MLFDQGKPAPVVARRMIEALRGVDVYADSEMDWRWLATLCTTADVYPVPAIGRFEVLLESVVGSLSPDTKELRVAQAIARAHAYAPRVHRAGPDAHHLRAVYLELLRSVAVRTMP